MIARINNIELNYDWITPPSVTDSTILLFLHEALGSIGQWREFPTQLCEKLGMKGLVYERQGHGKSSPLYEERTERYLHNYALIELPSFLEAIDMKENIILVGHSDGGSIALLYAHQFPKKVKAVVTMAAHVINEPETIAGITPAIHAWEDGKLKGLRKYHGDKTDAIFWAWANIWRNERFKAWDITKEIGSPAPHLCLQGENDQYGTQKQLKLLEEFAKAETELIPDSGHHPHLDQSKCVTSIICTFFINHHIVKNS